MFRRLVYPERAALLEKIKLEPSGEKPWFS